MRDGVKLSSCAMWGDLSDDERSYARRLARLQELEKEDYLGVKCKHAHKFGPRNKTGRCRECGTYIVKVKATMQAEWEGTRRKASSPPSLTKWVYERRSSGSPESLADYLKER